MMQTSSEKVFLNTSMQQGIGKGMVTKVARNNPTQVQPA
jgi:hypothetical protein